MVKNGKDMKVPDLKPQGEMGMNMFTVPDEADYNEKFGNIFSYFSGNQSEEEKVALRVRENKRSTDEFMLLFVK
jgi:hypothetical protein